MVTIASEIETVAPSEHDSTLARESSRSLSPHMSADLQLVTGGGEKIVLPASAVRLLVHLLSEMASGNAVTLIPTHAELTTIQAAQILGVSRPFLIKQLDAGLIKCRMVGAHRRIAFRDLMEYKENIDAKRHEALKELARQAQELNMGY